MSSRRSREDLEEAWTLGPDEHALISGKRGSTRLGFAVLVRFFAREGRFELDMDARLPLGGGVPHGSSG